LSLAALAAAFAPSASGSVVGNLVVGVCTSGAASGTVVRKHFEIQPTLETHGGTVSGPFDITHVPEPVSMALIGGGLVVLAAIKRRKHL
jgi:PEP-CTERM motif